MNDFSDKLTDVVRALVELAVIDDAKNPPCTVVLQSGISAKGMPTLSVKMWLPVDGERGKVSAYELNSEAAPEDYVHLLDKAREDLREKIRREQRGFN